MCSCRSRSLRSFLAFVFWDPAPGADRCVLSLDYGDEVASRSSPRRYAPHPKHMSLRSSDVPILARFRMLDMSDTIPGGYFYLSPSREQVVHDSTYRLKSSWSVGHKVVTRWYLPVPYVPVQERILQRRESGLVKPHLPLPGWSLDHLRCSILMPLI